MCVSMGIVCVCVCVSVNGYSKLSYLTPLCPRIQNNSNCTAATKGPEFSVKRRGGRKERRRREAGGNYKSGRQIEGV